MKTFTKHILLLALMLFGVAGAAWALPRAPQKFTSAVNLSVLQVGDTLAEGASITFDIGEPWWDRIMGVDKNRAKKNGHLVTGFYGEDFNNIDFTIGAGGVIIDGSNSFTPVTESGDDGDAWVVSYLNVEVEGELFDIDISGVLLPAPAPTVPALDELTGNWNFLMPGANKMLKVQFYDSIVVGPHVSVGGLAIEGKYANGTDTVYYYDTNSHTSPTLTAAANDGQGRNFGYWADLDPTDPEYSNYYRYISPASFTCGDTFRAVYLENYTLSLVTPQGGGTLSLDGVTYDTVYNIAFVHSGSSEDNRSFTIPASRLPYDTTFSYDVDVLLAQLQGASGKLSKIDGARTVTIRISGAFEGYGLYACLLDGAASDGWDITCEASIVPVPPYGISDNGDGTYSVMEGLIVNVTATPDSAHYLARIDGHDTAANAACGYTFTMPDDNTELAATFATKPVLTLDQTDGGTLEAIVPQGGVTAMHLTTDQIPTWSGNTEYAREADLQPFGFVAVDSAAAAAWTSVPASGQALLLYAPAGNSFKAILFQNGQWNDAYTANFYKGEFYTNSDNVYFTTGATRPNVIASSTPNTYIIDYGTPVTVKATPDSVHYLVSFSDDDNDTNSNIAVEKTYDSVIADIPLSATFQAKPTLTLAHNDGGVFEAVMPGDASADGEVQIGDGTGTTYYFPIDNYNRYSCTEQIYIADEIGTAGTINSISFYYNYGTPYTSSNATMYMKHVSRSEFAANTDCEPLSVNDIVWTGDIAPTEAGWYTFTLDTPFEYNGTDNLMVAFFDGTNGYAGTSYTWRQTPSPNSAKMSLRYYNDNNIPDPYNLSGYTGSKALHTFRSNIKLGIGNPAAGIAYNADSSAYIVDYGAKVTVRATPDSIHYLATLGGVTMGSNTAKDTTFTVTATTNLAATFAGKPVLSLASNEGGEMEVMPAGNVTASTEPNTYYIDYNTSVTVKATPSDTAYLVRFDNDADTNSNVAVEKTYGPLTAALTTAEATFNDKPTLTLTANDTNWGSVTLGGAGSSSGGPVDVTIGDSTSTNTNSFIPSNSLYEYSYIQEIYTASEIGAAGTIQSLTMWLENTSNYNRNIEIYMKEIEESTFADATSWVSLSDGDLVATGTIDTWVDNPIATTYTLNTPFEYSGNGNLLLCIRDVTGNWSSGVAGTVTDAVGNQAIYTNRDGTPYDISNPGMDGTLIQQKNVVKFHIDAAGSGLPAGVVKIDSVTYRVDYGTEVTVQADATELHHVANWVNEDSVAYPAADITYSAYFITEPEPLFPDSSTLTLTLTADATAKALFGINSYDVTATVATDNREEIGTGLPMGTVSATYVAQDGTPDQSVSPAANISYTAQGGSPSTLTATANYGYVFSGWQVGTETYNTATLTLTESATVTALFVPDTFTVSATPSIAGSATLSGTGRVAYRESTTLAATPETGYHFTGWTDAAATALGTEATLTVQALGDSSLVAVMDTNEYNVTYTVQTDDREVIGTGLAMGTVVLAGRHMHFLNDSLSVVPAYGFRFTGWYVEDALVSEQDTFIFSPENDTAFVARFVPDTFTVSLTMNDEHAGDVLPHGQLPAGVTAGPNVTYRVPYLVPMTFYGAALEHNHIVNWINENDAEYVDGVTYSDYIVCDTFPTTSLLTLAVTGDTTVKINFLVDYYYVTVGLDEESTGRGTATGSGYYDHGDSVTITALPAEGYHFDGWDNGVEISPYAFVAVQDSTILVHFDTNVYSLTVVAETDTNTGLPMGSTIGSGLVKHFLYYDIEAVPEEGYHFVMWTDSVTDNPRTVTLTENTTFTAHFEMDPIVDVVINGVSADETMGTVSGSDTVDYGEEVILTATANEHYHFVQWNDGNSDNPRTVVAAHDSTLTAYFAVNQYAVVGVSADETMGSVSGSDMVDYQSVVTLTATAGDCYHFESWSDGETANPRSIVAEADTTVSALFAANVYSMNDTVTVCDSYEWNGTVYTQSGTYTHDGTTAAGCDMLETLYLTVNASTTGIETVTACDSYEWHDSVYTASTDESTYQTTNAAGCDSTVTLHLTVNAATASEESETACNYYTWHGETYTVSGDYIYTTQNAAGCDSTVTLHLTVNYGNLISIDSTVCDSIVWRGNVYTESGVYDFDLPSESGCFSIETLNLTVNYSSSAVETIFACDSYTWNGLQFDADNHTATYLTVNAAGCDSTVTLDLTVHYSNSGSDYITACDSFEWHGTVYTASVDDVFYHGQNVAGCDSTVVLVLTINRSVSDTVEMTAEDSYEWNGEVYTQSGTYTYSGTTEAGCDSTVTLLLTITHQPQPVYYTVTLVSADTTMGSVLPEEAVSVEEGSMFTATALAIFGRHFVAWERDGQVVSTDNPYSFEVTEDVELTATFAYNPVTVILSVNNANWGSTDPAPGTYTYEVGEQATVTATPNEGFHMLGWTINGNVIETDETTYTVEATPEMAGMTFSVVAMFVRDIAIDDVDGSNIMVYTNGSKIVVSGAEHHDVYVYDVTGRCISRQTDAAETVVFPVAQTGVYMVKIGDLPARKVALVR